MPRVLLNSAEILRPGKGHHTAVATGDVLVFFSGAVALDENRAVREPNDLLAQSKYAMRNLGAMMRLAGAGWDDIVYRTIFTTRPTEYLTIYEGMDEVSGAALHPAQSVIGVSGLAVAELLVEIECVASVEQNAYEAAADGVASRT